MTILPHISRFSPKMSYDQLQEKLLNNLFENIYERNDPLIFYRIP